MQPEAKYKAKYGKTLKIFTPKQMLQRLPTAIAEVKTGNASKNLLNEIKKIIYYFYTANEITKKVYNNIMVLYFWILEIVKHMILKQTIAQSFR